MTASATACRFEDQQAAANGVVRNRGESPHHVQIAVRFVDADGVRIDIASDSISDLQPGESARWEATVFIEDGDDLAGCEVSLSAS